MYLALYARRAWVIFDHPYNAEYLRLSTWAGTSEYHAISSGYVLSQRPGGSGRCRIRRHVLRRLPCGQVVGATKQGDSDYVASCQDGNRYRVFTNAQGRVLVQKQ